MFHAALRAVRYAAPNGDSNRSRWPDHPIWEAVARALTDDLFEMTCGAEPERVKAVRREHLKETLWKQIIGTSATYAVACGMRGEALENLPETLMVTVANYLRSAPECFDEKLARAEDRYHFVTDHDTR